MAREGYNLRADSVVWNRTSGEVRAVGGVRVVSPGGDVAYGDSVVLEDTLRDGVIQNLLLVLADGGRLAAVTGKARQWRDDPRARRLHGLRRGRCRRAARASRPGRSTRCAWSTIRCATASPIRARPSICSACRSSLCPACPTRTAARAAAAACSCPKSASAGATASSSARLIISASRPIATSPSRRTSTPKCCRCWRRNIASSPASAPSSSTAMRPTARACRSTRSARDEGFRGYIEGNGRFQLSPAWSITASGRYVTDRTFLRRYDISRDDRLRSVVEAERIGTNSYISIAGWAFEGLRVTDVDGTQPIVLPVIDARWRIADPCWTAASNCRPTASLSTASKGQDSQRAFASFRWDRRRITPWGQELTLTAYGARRRLSRQRHALDPDRHLSRRGGLERPLHRRARGGNALAVRRANSWAAPSASRRACNSSPRRRPRIWTFRTRMRAPSISRIPTCSRSTASPATIAGRTACG